MGVSTGRITKDTWAAVRAELGALPDEERAQLEHLFEDELAKARRTRQAAATAAPFATNPQEQQAQSLVAYHDQMDFAHWANGGSASYTSTPHGSTVGLGEAAVSNGRGEKSVTELEEEWVVEVGRLIGCDRGVVPALLAVKVTLPKSIGDSVFGKQLFDELKLCC